MENKEKLILKQVSLKAAANVGGTADEVIANAVTFNKWLLEGEDITTSTKATTSTASTGNSAEYEPKCPGCSSFVWDNRDTATGNQPVWRCKNDDCTHGNFSKKYNKEMAWASWDKDEFNNAKLEFDAEYNASAVDLPPKSVEVEEEAEENYAPF